MQMKRTFKSGVVVEAPDDVTIVISAARPEDDKADGVIAGDEKTAGSLLLGAIRTFFGNLSKENRKKFVLAVMLIFHDYMVKVEDSDE
jgi:hypothetical protein